MKLMVALTSDKGAGPDSDITLEVANSLDVLISLMKEGRLITRTRLLAAETVANILVNKEVFQVHVPLWRLFDGQNFCLLFQLTLD